MARKTNRFVPPENLADRVAVPPERIVVVGLDDNSEALARELVQPLRGNKRRGWFHEHAYSCVPLMIANQYGFMVKSLYDFWVTWNGGDNPGDVTVEKMPADEPAYGVQLVASHFGMGTVTIQNPWAFRTPKDVNLMTIAPPNFVLDGVMHMTAVIETDNLRRDFTFNLRITRPNHQIFVPKGSPIGCVIPYPRHFIDGYQLAMANDVLPRDVVEDERRTQLYHGIERSTYDTENPGSMGFRYRDGVDIYGNRFPDHQANLDPEEDR